MAKLLFEEYPFPELKDFGGDWNKYFKAQDEALNAIPEDKLLQFPVGDGHAFYYIACLSPLILQHIPFGDNWSIPDAYIRGLTTTDAKKQIEREIMFGNIFEAK